MRRNSKLPVFALLLIAGLSVSSLVQAQVAAPTPPSGNDTPSRSSTPVVADGTTAPQVVTILHRLNGLKMLGLLLRYDDKLRAIRELDDGFKLMGDVHTNVIAGLAIDDGRTVVVRLPEVEAEMGSQLLPFSPKVPHAPSWPSPPTWPTEEWFEAPDVTVVARGGKQFAARYIGLDGITGLSILKLDDKGFLPTVAPKSELVNVGQRLRVFAPVPVAPALPTGRITVKVGETEGTVTKVTKAPTGRVSRLKIKSTGLSQTNIGGIATNESGETVGIIDNIEQGEANVLATGQIMSAALRVMEKQSSVPKPWLGISGEPITAVTTSSLVNKGWHESEAMALTQERHGILLTSVAPDSPASMAALRPGDVIIRMNGEYIRNADDFSWQLEQAGPGAAVTFTVRHPGRDGSESVNLTLSGSFFPGLAAKIWAKSTPHWKNTFFEKHGIETVNLTPGVAMSLGASEGLLVFSVEPDSDAFKAGLRPGDVIETINGQRVLPGNIRLATEPGKTITLAVVRRKQKLTFTLANPPQ